MMMILNAERVQVATRRGRLMPTWFTGSRQTSAPALAVFAPQIHGLRGTSDDVF